jgi:hypothetical protein
MIYAEIAVKDGHEKHRYNGRHAVENVQVARSAVCEEEQESYHESAVDRHLEGTQDGLLPLAEPHVARPREMPSSNVDRRFQSA